MASFSQRTSWDRSANRLAAREEQLLREGRTLIDLTESNPTVVGLSYPTEEVASALGEAARLTYRPEPRGAAVARAALCAQLADEGAQVDPEQVVLTAGTSEAYGYLFKLLCDPGDQVLVPGPCYPLFDFLTGLDSANPVPYALAFDGEWRLDVAQLSAQAGPRTRAVLVVNPGNPTGAFLKEGELVALSALCAARGWALVADEVFNAYGTGSDPHRVRSLAGRDLPALTFALGGLSKGFGLPQLKLAWVVAGGPRALRDEALARLELVADTYLTASPVVQHALPRLLPAGLRVRAQLVQRVAQNRRALEAVRAPDAPWSVLPSEGGWSALLRVPAEPGEEALCLKLLEAGVRAHPGYFFDFPRGHHLVVSLLPEPQLFAEGLAHLSSVLGP